MVVEEPVKDLEAKMAHPDLVEIREGEADARIGTLPILTALSLLSAKVLGGLLHSREERSVGMFEFTHNETLAVFSS